MFRCRGGGLSRAHSVGRPPCRETVVGWDKFWLGQCPSVLNESPDGDIIFMNDDLTTMRSKLVQYTNLNVTDL